MIQQLFLTERETADVLRVHPATLGRLVKSGRAPVAPVQVGGRRVYPLAAVQALATVAA